MEKEPIKDLPNKPSTPDNASSGKKGALTAEELGKVSGGRMPATTCPTDKGDGCDE